MGMCASSHLVSGVSIAVHQQLSCTRLGRVMGRTIVVGVVDWWKCGSGRKRSAVRNWQTKSIVM